MSLSYKAQQQILRQRIRAMFPYLIKIYFPSYGSFYYINADEEKQWQGHTYVPCMFSINPPDKTESKIGDGQLTFSSIYNNSEWIKKIRSCPSGERGTIEVVGAIIYSADNVQDGIEPITDTVFTLSDATWTNETITWTMKFDEGMDIVMPCDRLDEIVCPGLA